MGLAQRVNSLSAEMADMKQELVQTRADLRQVLQSLVGLTEPAVPVPSAVSSPADQADAHKPAGRRAADSAKRGGRRATAGAGAGRSGGLVLSSEELSLIMGEAIAGSSGRRPTGGPRPALSLERLSDGLERGRQHRALANASGGEQGSTVKMSLAELAAALKQVQSGRSPGWGVGRPKVPQVRPVDGARRARGDSAPTAKETRSQTESGHGGRKPQSIWSEGNMDVNLMANLIRWTASSRRRLGAYHLRGLLEVYGLTGHLPGAIQKAILLIAGIGPAPAVHARQACTQDDLIDTMLLLHGIVYGSGSAPVVPAVALDLSGGLLEELAGQAERRSSADKAAQRAGPSDHDSEPIEVGRSDAPGDVPRHTAEPASATTQVGRQGFVEVLDSLGGSELLEGLGLGAKASSRSVVDHVAGAPTQIASAAVQKASTAEAAISRSRASYHTDLADEEWSAVESVVPAAKPGGRPPKYERREIVNGILYHLGTGCSWRSLPKDLPAWKIVHHYYKAWRDDGTWMAVMERLSGLNNHPEPAEPQREGTPELAGVAVADSQSVARSSAGSTTGTGA